MKTNSDSSSAPELKVFKELSLPPIILKALDELKFTEPTPIQTLAIPTAIEGRDLIACAPTGSGKTLAFLLPFLSKMDPRNPAMALVLTPTRELAIQISQVLKKLAERLPHGIRASLVVGGESMRGQIKALSARPQIIVATPGRLVDHLQRGTVNLRKVSYLVLDEADRMLDMGFAPQLDKILEEVPDERQTLLFSATLAPPIRKLAEKRMQDPAFLEVRQSTETLSPQIEQRVIEVTRDDKGDALIRELEAAKGSVIVFVRTKIRTERVARLLRNSGVSSTLIHGDRSQGQRRYAIEGFRNGEFRVLVATDVAARGIDISHVGHVINFDLPQMPEDYVHRIGRTGRAGASGIAISLVTDEEKPLWRAIEHFIDPTKKPAPRSSGGGGFRRGGHGGGGGGRPRSGGGSGHRGGGGSGGAGRPHGKPAGGRSFAHKKKTGAAFKPAGKK